MKPGLWVAGILAAVAVGGTLWYLRRILGEESIDLCIADDDNGLRSIGAMTPVVTEEDFDGMNFLF